MNKIFYSAQTGGFYTREIHGDFKIRVIDPNWTRPVHDVVLQPGESVQINEDGDRFKNLSDKPFTLASTPDFTIEAPTVEIDNPNCKIPADAVEITPEQHAALLQGQSEGKVIAADENGYPVLVDPPPAPPYVPQQVTRAQGKAALIVVGLWDDVVDYVNNIKDPTEKALALVALNDTTHWQRNSPFLNSAAAALGLSSEDLDSLFIQADSIKL